MFQACSTFSKLAKKYPSYQSYFMTSLLQKKKKKTSFNKLLRWQLTSQVEKHLLITTEKRTRGFRYPGPSWLLPLLFLACHEHTEAGKASARKGWAFLCLSTSFDRLTGDWSLRGRGKSEVLTSHRPSVQTVRRKPCTQRVSQTTEAGMWNKRIIRNVKDLHFTKCYLP